MTTHGPILLVDDNAELMLALAQLLRAHGHEVEVATSAREALARIHTTCPRLLVVDMQLPEMSGLELIQHARAHCAGLATIVVSGFPREYPPVTHAIETQGSHYASKPLDVRRLLQLIDNSA